ncbi:MAG: hypothetical protein AABZ74_18955 [Cyanobacteriota bacterium]
MEINSYIANVCEEDNLDEFFELITLDDLKHSSKENKDLLLYLCFVGGNISEFRLAKIFLEYGANINYFPYGEEKHSTILWNAMQSKYDIYFQELGTDGEERQVYEIKGIIFLLKNGADPNIKGIFCTKHKTCLDIAIELYNLDN